MQKKVITITLVNGRVIEKDITFAKVAPLGAPAHDEAYASLIMMYSVQGFIDPEVANEKELGYIPPAQIKSVKLKFQ